MNYSTSKDSSIEPLPYRQRQDPRAQLDQALRVVNSLHQDRLELLAREQDLGSPDDALLRLDQSSNPAGLMRLLVKANPHLNPQHLEAANPEQLATSLFSLLADPPEP